MFLLLINASNNKWIHLSEKQFWGWLHLNTPKGVRVPMDFGRGAVTFLGEKITQCPTTWAYGLLDDLEMYDKQNRQQFLHLIKLL